MAREIQYVLRMYIQVSLLESYVSVLISKLTALLTNDQRDGIRVSAIAIVKRLKLNDVIICLDYLLMT